MDRFLLHRRLQDQFDEGPLRERDCLQSAAIHRNISDSVGHGGLLVVENLDLDGGRETCVLTPVEYLRVVARTGIERAKAILAQLASKRKHLDAAQQILDPTLRVGHANE